MSGNRNFPARYAQPQTSQQVQITLKGRKSLMVVLRIEGSIIVSREGPPQIQFGGDDVVMISELIGLECSEVVYNTTEMEINRKFYTFTDF
jgi:hypothetical protein